MCILWINFILKIDSGLVETDLVREMIQFLQKMMKWLSISFCVNYITFNKLLILIKIRNNVETFLSHT